MRLLKRSGSGSGSNSGSYLAVYKESVISARYFMIAMFITFLMTTVPVWCPWWSFMTVIPIHGSQMSIMALVTVILTMALMTVMSLMFMMAFMTVIYKMPVRSSMQARLSCCKRRYPITPPLPKSGSYKSNSETESVKYIFADPDSLHCMSVRYKYR